MTEPPQPPQPVDWYTSGSNAELYRRLTGARVFRAAFGGGLNGGEWYIESGDPRHWAEVPWLPAMALTVSTQMARRGYKLALTEYPHEGESESYATLSRRDVSGYAMHTAPGYAICMAALKALIAEEAAVEGR